MCKLLLVLILALLAAAPVARAQNPVAVGGEFQVNTYTTDYQGQPSVAAAPDGDFVVVWASLGSDNGDTSNQSVQGQRYASNGDALGAQFLVNSYITGMQLFPSVAVASDGDFVVAWQSLGSDNGDMELTSIQGQRYASNGDALGAQFLVNSYTTNGQSRPAVAVAPDGDFVIVWQSAGSDNGDTSSESVQGQRYASNGDALGAQFLVNSYITDMQRNPSVAVDADGDFVVVWHSFGSDNGDTSSSFSVQGQRYASNGDALGAQFLVNSYTTNSQSIPSLAMHPYGDFVVVWQSYGSDNGDTLSDSVQGQRFDSNGGSLGAQFLVNSYTTSGQVLPSVAVDPYGGFVVVWQSYGSDNGDTSITSIQGQRYASNGDALGAQFLVNSYTTDAQYEPVVAADADGDFVVVWMSYSSGGGDTYYSVQGQRFRVLGKVGDRVWRDTNANGVQDGGEPGVSGVTVILHDALGALVDQTQTDADGAYELWAKPGDYYLEFVAPGGDQFTSRDIGLDDTLDSDAAEDGVTIVFSIDALGGDTSRDAGLVATTAQVGDRVWLDANADGVLDGGEDGIAGITVRLYREPDPPFFAETAAALEASDVTDSNGYYSFSVAPGTFYLELDCSAESFTAQDQGGDDALDSDVKPSTATTSPFVLGAGAADGTRDAGLLDGDGDGVACSDNCPADANAGQEDGDGDGVGDACDLCAGDNATGDGDGDGICADLDCDDSDPANVCLVFSDGFESGDTLAWSSTLP